MQNHIPEVIGRSANDDYLDNRALTEEVASVIVPFDGGAVGSISVTIFKSVDNDDRGGVVLRITGTDDASAFIPHGVELPDGLEIHLAGDIEGESIIRALRGALAQLPY